MCFSVLLCLFLISACGKSKDNPGPLDGNGNVVKPGAIPEDWQPLDVSDVAFLWPQMSGNNFNRLLPIASSEGDIIPSRQMIRDLLSFSQGQSSQLNSVRNRNEDISRQTRSWNGVRLGQIRVIGFRVENCGDAVRGHDGFGRSNKWSVGQRGAGANLRRDVVNQCAPMIRLVAQPVRGDNALHLIYKFSDQAVGFEMMRDLQVLKKISPVLTNGVPLGVHPGLLRERGVGAFSERVKSFIKKYARGDRLATAAFLATNTSNNSEWNFFEANVTNNNPNNFSWEMNPLLALRGNPVSQGFTVSQSDNVRRGSINIASLNNNIPRPQDLERTMDPTKTFASSLDCKSCHLSSTVAVAIAGSTDQFRDYFRRNDSVWSAPGITSVPDSRAIPRSPLNFRAFGWFNGEGPTVSIRVAKKAASVAASMNLQFFGRVDGNGTRCDGREHQLLRCMIQNAGSQSNCIQRSCQN